MGNDGWNPTLNIAMIRQSLTTGSSSFGGIGFSTIDDSNNAGMYDAGRIAIVNEIVSAVASPVAMAFYTQVGSATTTNAATERMRITGAGNVLIGTTAASGTLNGSSQPRLIVGTAGAGGFGAIYGASGGGTTYFPVNNGFGYRVTIWSTQSSINAKIGVYIFVGLNKGAGYNPVILTVNTVNSPDWSFSYALLNSNDCTVGVNDGGGNQGTRVVV